MVIGQLFLLCYCYFMVPCPFSLSSAHSARLHTHTNTQVKTTPTLRVRLLSVGQSVGGNRKPPDFEDLGIEIEMDDRLVVCFFLLRERLSVTRQYNKEARRNDVNTHVSRRRKETRLIGLIRIDRCALARSFCSNNLIEMERFQLFCLASPLTLLCYCYCRCTFSVN